MKEQELFEAALERDANLRAAYLDEACGADSELRRRIETLLQFHEHSGDFFEKPAAGIVATAQISEVTEKPGTLIGPYKLLEQIGEGGMGLVFMARQQEPIKRNVALKVIKPGMDTKQVIARFEAERQALAMMDHPNIAKVHDAGATETGRPYFVMELVRGVPITQHCDENNLTTNERLQLFLDVCRAIQHAHLKGIIHRDIKPTNVMVTLLDGEPVPKVIDFGIAKATQKLLTEKTSLTSDGQFLGTPQYMSPEQAGMSDLDVDIRTDVYSLGVVLYELLVGSTPFDPEQLRQAGYDDMCRIIRETDPPTPSNQLSTLVAATTEVFKHRRTQPAALRKQLRGDLDCIVMKTLEKDRDDRYATAQALSDDLRRHLEQLPIRARRPTLLQRMIKKSRRHRAAVVFAGALLIVVMVGSIVSAALLWAKQRETNRALATAKQKVEEAKAITDFLVKDLLGSMAPDRAKGREVTVNEVLANAEAKINTAFENEPLTEAAVRSTMARVLSRLGRYTDARSHAEHARELRTALHGVEHVDTLRATSDLAIVLSGQGKLKEARKLFEESLEAHRRVLGPDHSDTCAAMNNLAIVLMEQNELDRARQLFEQVLDVQRRILGVDHPDTLPPKMNVAKLLLQQGKQGEYQEHCKSLLEACRCILGPDHPTTDQVMVNLARLLFDQGELNEARKIEEQLLETRWRTSGACSLGTFVSAGDLIAIRIMQDGTAEIPGFSAETESIERAKEICPNIFFLATAHWHLGDEEAARRWYDKAVEWMDKHKPNDKELVRFRDNAAKLINIENKDKGASHQER